jgi:hypothetical protein
MIALHGVYLNGIRMVRCVADKNLVVMPYLASLAIPRPAARKSATIASDFLFNRKLDAASLIEVARGYLKNLLHLKGHKSPRVTGLGGAET